MRYSARKIERKWQQKWKENKTYKVEINDQPKFYVLDMFPYPSGAGLHVGHPLGYIASDIISRHRRMQGMNVLHPMGYDSFGLPAEQYAIQKGIHPAKATEENIRVFRRQLENIGLSYDWSREVRTSDPSYYKWTQKIFLLLFDHYYNTADQKAKPIAELTKKIEKKGTAELDAFGAAPLEVTAEDWKQMSAKEQDETLMNYRLAYRSIGFVNWCEELGTVLANDEVIDGKSERGGYPVIQKPMLQWSLRITAYAERLLEGLEHLDWSDALKTQQKHWIGKSTGASIRFSLSESQGEIEVFSTRPDTIFGCTFMVLAPEHELVEEITREDQREEVEKYLQYVSQRSERERMADQKVTGANTGAYVIHPFTGDRIPIYISDYVLKDYGTGAVMAVPGHDERDRAFAEKFELPIPVVVDFEENDHANIEDKSGTMINSDFLNGLSVENAIQKVTKKLKETEAGRKTINYKLRDANFSRQRYWGEPFPILYDENDIPHPFDEKDLPVELPEMDTIEQIDGKSPLTAKKDWIHEFEGYRKEVDTMPGFAGSSWYFLRYMDPHNDREMFSREAVSYWRDVDYYIGGTEHAVGHLMYARFWHKFLYDIGYVPTEEPFKKLVNQGMIQGRSLFLKVGKDSHTRRLHIPISLADDQDRLYRDAFEDLVRDDNRFEGIDHEAEIKWQKDEKGAQFVQLEPEVEKMSKSKYNVVNPDEVIEEYGADCFRLFEMFLGPIEDHKPWDTQSITGVVKFINRFWGLFFEDDKGWIVTEEAPSTDELKILHQCIKKVTEDIERLSFNTCISAMMICVNELRSLNCSKRAILEPLCLLMSPFAPHIAEEIYREWYPERTVTKASYPVHDEKYLVEDEIEFPICINGKKRGSASFPADLEKEELIERAKELEVVQKWSEGKQILKVIVVPGRMINFVVN